MPSAASVDGDGTAAPANLAIDGSTCRDEVAFEVQKLFAMHDLVVTNSRLWDGHLGEIIDDACRRFPARSVEKKAEWVFQCLGIGRGVMLEGVQKVSTDSSAPWQAAGRQLGSRSPPAGHDERLSSAQHLWT
jgi:hypothetical protein